MRATAALIVFLVHLRGSAFVEFGALPQDQQGHFAKAIFGILRLGHEAVLVFFVLSGFLVGGQIIRRLGDGSFDIGSYFIDRITRILVPLIPACLLTVALSAWLGGIPTNWMQVVGNMTGLNGVVVSGLPNNAPLWSLAYEIWFYVLAGAIGLMLSSKPGGGLPTI